jgi:hypothetical protein
MFLLNCALWLISIDRFHLTSRRPYWCTKTMKWRPYWCTVRELALSYSNISYCFTTPLGPPITWVKTIYTSKSSCLISRPGKVGSYKQPLIQQIAHGAILWGWGSTFLAIVTSSLNMKYCVYVCPVSLAELCIAERQLDFICNVRTNVWMIRFMTYFDVTEILQ